LVFFFHPLKLAPHVLPPRFATLELPRVYGPLPAEELVRCHQRRSALAECRHVVDDRRRDPRHALVGGLFLATMRLSRQRKFTWGGTPELLLGPPHFKGDGEQLVPVYRPVSSNPRISPPVGSTLSSLLASASPSGAIHPAASNASMILSA